MQEVALSRPRHGAWLLVEHGSLVGCWAMVPTLPRTQDHAGRALSLFLPTSALPKFGWIAVCVEDDGRRLGDRAVTWAFACQVGRSSCTCASRSPLYTGQSLSPVSTEESIRAHVASLWWWPQTVASVMVVGGVSATIEVTSPPHPRLSEQDCPGNSPPADIQVGGHLFNSGPLSLTLSSSKLDPGQDHPVLTHLFTHSFIHPPYSFHFHSSPSSSIPSLS